MVDSQGRVGCVQGATRESCIIVELNLDGNGSNKNSAGVPFYDHMLAAFSKYLLIDMRIKVEGDTHINAHHIVENTAIHIGQTLAIALGDESGISRFGDGKVPLSETLVRAVVDIAGRIYCIHEGEPEGREYNLIVGHYIGSLTRHIWESVAHNAKICLHVDVIHGRNPHHIVEVQFKAVAQALRIAVKPDSRMQRIPSIKGAL